MYFYISDKGIGFIENKFDLNGGISFTSTFNNYSEYIFKSFRLSKIGLILYLNASNVILQYIIFQGKDTLGQFQSFMYSSFSSYGMF